MSRRDLAALAQWDRLLTAQVCAFRRVAPQDERPDDELRAEFFWLWVSDGFVRHDGDCYHLPRVSGLEKLLSELRLVGSH